MIEKREKYNIKLNNFEGPLDLLLSLIEKNKMDIYNISVNEIADQYMEYINSVEALNLEITSDFLVMASNLIYIKSKSLLPKKQAENEEENLEEELIKQITEYKQLKEVALKIKEDAEKNSGIYYKKPEELEKKKEPIRLTKTYDNSLIPKIFLKIEQININKINHNLEDIKKIIERDSVTVKDKIKYILKYLIKNKNMLFNKEFNTKNMSKNEIITSFMAILELNKRERIDIFQKVVYGDINIVKKEYERKVKYAVN